MPTKPPISIDLNADMGERPDALDADFALLEHITSINIACAQHAGDEPTARALVRRAIELGRAIGAHPSYPDRAGFGRTKLDLPAHAIADTVRTQVAWLAEIVATEGGVLRHVKPHGALYHAAHDDPGIASAIGAATRAVDPALALLGAPHGSALKTWDAMNLRSAAEGFADRRYESTGQLRSREHDDALLDAPDEAAAQAAMIACERAVVAHDGARVALACETLCVHSDTPNALAIAQAVRAALESCGVFVAPLSK